MGTLEVKPGASVKLVRGRGTRSRGSPEKRSAERVAPRGTGNVELTPLAWLDVLEKQHRRPQVSASPADGRDGCFHAARRVNGLICLVPVFTRTVGRCGRCVYSRRKRKREQTGGKKAKEASKQARVMDAWVWRGMQQQSDDAYQLQSSVSRSGYRQMEQTSASGLRLLGPTRPRLRPAASPSHRSVPEPSHSAIANLRAAANGGRGGKWERARKGGNKGVEGSRGRYDAAARHGGGGLLPFLPI